ncbi:MAG: hypothetical protein CM15mP130_1700 [Verrucomicrobiota bacterium]|nr:MAG: hypothetical protein CM15mP130_1700 [Verrucomicrobiota bacterium]
MIRTLLSPRGIHPPTTPKQTDGSALLGGHPGTREEMVKYYAEITNFDRLVGMMRKELEKRKLWDETVFMVCSEQGTQLPFAKWTCYDNGLRTGLVMRWPG